jgi:hypothetical protein
VSDTTRCPRLSSQSASGFGALSSRRKARTCGEPAVRCMLKQRLPMSTAEPRRYRGA